MTQTKRVLYHAPCSFQVIKLGDLGIAKQLEGTLELAITCLGTPLYM
jgi:hypothetical protein